jgi:RNA polymerase sigma-70 factor, ECF subfamily
VSSNYTQSSLGELRQGLEREFKLHRPFLLLLAQRQLREPRDAEDAVQDTLLAAWQTIEAFDSRSTLRTWLVGILRFKLIDTLRSSYRHHARMECVMDELQQQDFSSLFDEHEQWLATSTPWTSPQTALESKQLLATLEACLTRLPEQTGRVFLMREYLGFKATEIASLIHLEDGHVRVLLLRARMSLRLCLGIQLTGVQA